MKGDFTRFTHRPEKGYTQVRRQQGRVDLDADWNEYIDISQHLSRTQAIDVIGPCGVPKEGGGFAVTAGTADGADLTLSPGRIYVDGLLCELPAGPTLVIASFPANNQIQLADADAGDALSEGQAVLVSAAGVTPALYRVTTNDGNGHLTVDGDTTAFSGTDAVLQPLHSYLHQSDLHSPPELGLSGTGRTDLLYLDVWERHITVIEDPQIREVALGGPDTTTRVKTVCQVKVLEDVGDVTCADDLSDWPPGPGDGRLSTAANAPAADSDPCIVSPGGGYKGLENRLYRVEVHDGSASGTPTFKWSRDNGSIVFAIEEFIAGEPEKVRVQQLGRDEVLNLNQFDWVEISDDATELSGGPGIVAEIVDIDEAGRILTLSKNVSGFDPAGHPKVRRWDMGSDVIEIAPGTILLEDGVEINFSGADFRGGDYWTFAARTVTGNNDSGIEELAAALPAGIKHHYCALAIVSWQLVDEAWTASIEDCRPRFPSLTNICAEDVCYDDSNCDGLQAETVQEALDQLCARNDLPHHNKHLHGMGIVCGLQVHCGDDDPAVSGDRRTVILRPGYAIDCEGYDIVLKDDLVIDALDMIAAYDEENPNNPILTNGQGDAVILVERDENGQPRIRIRPYDPAQNTLQSMLQGTLLMDFIEECILEPLEELRDLLSAIDNGDTRLVNASRRQFITLVNLIAQFWQPHGPHVYLSLREHELLEKLYFFVRGIIQSKTFCAMFDNVRQFPAYPFPEANMTTIFDTNIRTRMRIHPENNFGFSVGNDATIHVYDLEANEVVGVETMPGSGVQARDVAFSEDGRQLYAIGTLSGGNTIFATADISDAKVVWRPMTVLCDCELVTLVRTQVTGNVILAIGKNVGLFVINPDSVTGDITPAVSFPAVGHLEIDPRTQLAFATQLAPEDNFPHATTTITDRTYDSVIEIDLVKMQATGRVYRPVVEGLNWVGEDDIAVANGPKGTKPSRLFIVTDNPTPEAESSVFSYAVQSEEIIARIDRVSEALQLGYVLSSNFLALIAPNEFTVQLLNVVTNEMVKGYELPLQLVPVDMAVAAGLKRVYFINALSQTITVLGIEHLQPQEDGSGPAPGSAEFMELLMAYRLDIFGAFVDLTAGLVQYLKDCFCDRLLVNCPECKEDDEVVLGVVSIRGDEVHRVCNFSGRTYVKSFPTVGYWLSAIPVAPFIHKIVETFCCSVIMDTAREFTNTDNIRVMSRVKSRDALSAASYYQTGRLRTQFTGLREQLSLGRLLTTDWVSTIFKDAVEERPQREKGVLAKSDLVNVSVNEAQRRATAANVTVEKVETYDPRQGTEYLRSLARMPAKLPRGTRLTLYEQDGVVKYYSTAAALRTPAEPREEVAVLQKSVGELQTKLNEKDTELVALRQQLAAVEEVQATLKKPDPKIRELEAELEELRNFRTEVRRFMEKNQ